MSHGIQSAVVSNMTVLVVVAMLSIRANRGFKIYRYKDVGAKILSESMCNESNCNALIEVTLCS